MRISIVLLVFIILPCSTLSTEDARVILVVEPRETNAILGQPLTIRCHLNIKSTLKVRWFRNGLQITDNEGSIFDEYAITGDPDQGQCNLLIKNVSLDDSAVFLCRHILATLQDQSANVTVIAPFDKVQIKELRQEYFLCNATRGHPAAARVLWKINGEVVKEDEEPSSGPETDRLFWSSSPYEIGRSGYHSDINLTCEVIQVDEVESVKTSLILSGNNAGVNTAAMAVIFCLDLLALLIG